MKHVDRLYWMFYTFIYMSIGTLMPLIGKYLQHLDFSGSRIGIITGAGTATAIVATLFWTGIYGRIYRRFILIGLLCIAASSVGHIIKSVETYQLFIPVFCCIYFFQAPIIPLADTFTVETTRNDRFGMYRMWGAAGFASGTFLGGTMADISGIKTIFDIYSLCFLVAAVGIFAIGIRNKNKIKPVSGNKSKNGGYGEVIKNRKLIKFIICTFFFGGTNVANNTFFSFVYVDGGGTLTGFGLIMLLMVGSEIPFMASWQKLSHMLGIKKLIIYSMIISSIRFFLIGMGLPWWGLIFPALLQGAVNGILLIGFVKYIAGLTSKSCLSAAVSLYYIIGSNVSSVACQISGGLIMDFANARGVYIFFGILNAIGISLYIKFGFHSNKNE